MKTNIVLISLVLVIAGNFGIAVRSIKSDLKPGVTTTYVVVSRTTEDPYKMKKKWLFIAGFLLLLALAFVPFDTTVVPKWHI